MTVEEAIKKSKPRKTLNKALLKKVAMRLRRLRHEEHYDQSVWGRRTSCGTAACIAGWTALEVGVSASDLCEGNGGKGNWAAEKLATLRLGLPDRWAYYLFHPTPTVMWPRLFRSRLLEPKDRPSRVAADLLDAIADGTTVLGED